MSTCVGFIVFPDFNLLDLSGPLTVFETANHHLPDAMRYRLEVCSLQAGMIRSSSGLCVQANAVPQAVFDTLMLVGGRGVDAACNDRELVAWLARDVATRYASVCTGAFLLAASGRLVGKVFTTHWRRAAELQHQGGRLLADRMVVQDGAVWSSAGATAGMDIALALLEADHGAALANLVARELLIAKRRVHGQSQFTRLQELTPPAPRLQKVLQFIRDNLRADLSVAALAEQAHLSTRQFTRDFIKHTGMPPARAVERFRVEYARSEIENSNRTLAAIARDAGFSDTALMRKAFLRSFNTTPQRLRVPDAPGAAV